jgi:hypothetical protein
MQLASYRNTERSARPLVTEEDRLASQVAFLERRKRELGAELTALVNQRQKAMKTFAYERTQARAKMKREREEFTREIIAHETRVENILSVLRRNGLSHLPTCLSSLETVAARICRALHVSAVELAASTQRDKRLSFARHAFCYWAFRRCGASTNQIARFLGVDHTSVLYAKRHYALKRQRMGRTLRASR